MTPVERKRLWQQHITDWQASGLSGKVAPTVKTVFTRV
jgi:hypothetical protein